jgi:hypothetical protein
MSTELLLAENEALGGKIQARAKENKAKRPLRGLAAMNLFFRSSLPF